MSPEAIVDLQIEAFNRHDAEAFAALYAADAVITNAMSNDPAICGRTAIRDHYLALFQALPNLEASIIQRLVVGNLITDHEHLPSLGARAIATYEIKDALISRAWLFGPMAT